MAAPPVFWDIVEDSLEEAEFLWRRFEAALVAPDQRLDDIATWIHDRLLGGIDGLVVSGTPGIDRILAPVLEEGGDPHRVAVVAHALAVSGTPPALERIAAALSGARPPVRMAVRRGLELANRDDMQPMLARLVEGANNSARAALLEAASFRRCFLPTDFGACFGSANTDLQRAAAEHLRCAPIHVQREWIDRALHHLVPAAKPTAVETALLLGRPDALDVCRDLATADIAAKPEMLLLLAMLGTPRDHERVVAALAKPDRRRAAVWALGFAGRKSGAAACVDLMAQDLETKLAAEAFVAITGVDLVALGMVGPAKAEADEPVAFEADDLDVDLVGGPEDRLPEPDVPSIIRWWGKNQRAFDDQARYLGGQPMTFESLQQALDTGPTRRRHAIARELAIRTGGRYRVETRDFPDVQRRQMNLFGSLSRDAFGGAFARELPRPARVG